MTEEVLIERRITLRLLAYWEKLRDDRVMPEEGDIDPDDIADLWSHCFLIRVQDLAQNDYSFSYLGPAIIEAYRGGLSADDPSSLVSPNARHIAASYSKVMETSKPLLEEGEFRNLRNDLVKYRQCLLPLGSDGQVNGIFGGMRFKVLVSEPGR